MRNKYDEVKTLPQELRDEFFGVETSGWKFHEEELSELEYKVLKSIIKNSGLEFKEIYRIPEVEFPEGIKTPDLLIDGIKTEIKSITSKRSIEEQTSKASKQVLESGWVFYDISRSDLSKNEIMSEILKRVEKKNILGFSIVKDERLIDFKTKRKDDLATSSHAGIDSKSSYTSILPQSHQKVNRIAPALAQKSNKYWRERSLQRTVDAERQALPYLRRLSEEYALSSKRSIDQVRRIYENYFGANGFDRQKLREIVPSGEISKYLKEVRKLGIELPDNYKYRVNREEFTQAQLWLEAKKLGVFENQLSQDLYSGIIQKAMSQTFGDYGVSFNELNRSAMNEILQAKFVGENFSTRIWGRTDRLADELQAKMAFAVAKGESWERTSREIRERFGVAQSSAERLVRPETNYFENRAELEAYRQMGVKEFEFLAELDNRTSEVCRHHHKKRVKIEKAQSGENVPPLHPNCRSTIVAILPEFEEKTQVVEEDQGAGENINVQIIKPKIKAGVKALDFGDSKLSKFDPEIMKAHSEEAEKIFNKYPKIREYLIKNGGLDIKITKSSKYAAAVTSEVSLLDNSRVRIVGLKMSQLYYRDKEKLQDAVKSNVKYGLYMPIKEKYINNYFISHEFGHILENYILIQKGGDSRLWAMDIKNDILKRASIYEKTSPEEVERKHMSRYGKTDSEEFFAEAFAGLRCGVNNPITKAMNEYLKENL